MNPVKSRLCELPGSGSNSPKIGYIKLTTFNQNASGMHSIIPSYKFVYFLAQSRTLLCVGAVKEAIETLRGNNVNAFVLDLRDNR